MNIINDLPPFAKPKEFFALDVEMFGMEKKLLHRPTTGRFACVTICLESDPDTVYYISDQNLVGSVLVAGMKGVWTFHNAKFDIMQLRRYAEIPPRKMLWDVMLIDQIQHLGYFSFFSLADIARRELDIYLDKSLQKSFENSSEMSDAQIEYACNDTRVTLQIALHQKRNITKTEFKIWKEIELPFMWALLDFKGFRIDIDRWESLADHALEAITKIKEDMKFNPSSPQQIVKHLKELGFKNLPDSQGETLEKWITKYPNAPAVPVAKSILRFKDDYQNATKYGRNFTNTYAEKEGDIWVIYGNYKQMGAETSRTSCENPNMQNIPHRYGPQHRECFIARPGHKLVIMDFSQQEPNLSAFYSQDANLLKANRSGSDIYIETAKIFYAKEITKASPERKDMKSIFLGLDYGMSSKGLALRLGITEEAAEKLIKRFFATFPGMKLWSTEQKKKKAFVTTMTGRKLYLNVYSSQRERNALNAPHQGGGSEIMKVTLIGLHQNWNPEWGDLFGSVAEIHDEIILDVPEEYAKDVAKFAEETANVAGGMLCPGIVFRVGIEIGDNWSVKE